MITIITGTPGAGKTALAVDMLTEVKDRPVFVDGIPELQIPHEVCEGKDWPSLPDGSLIVIDEAQRVFRPRSQGSAVPEYVAQLETHRHRGIDIWLVTQHPTLLDANVRKLCNRHIHIRSLWAGRRLYEWSEVADPSSRTERESSASRKYSLPKKVFGLYKSASLHTKQSRRIPFMAYVVGFAIIAVPALGWRMYDSITARIDPTGSVAATGAPTGSTAQPANGGAPAQQSVKVVGADWSEFIPRISAKPETAPIYDGVRQVKVMPIVAGCVAMRDRCACFTQQGTPAGLSEGECRSWLDNPPFNPYAEPPAMVREQVKLSGDHPDPV